MRRDFPTRSYPYRRPSPTQGAMPFIPVPAGKVFKFVLGRDAPPGREMTSAELSAQSDSFAKLILQPGLRPATLAALLNDLDQYNAQPEGLPAQASFVVAEGGQIPWSPATAHLDRGVRFVVARGRGDAFDFFISTTTPFDAPDIFLQVLAWDAEAKAFQFYERRLGSWFWAGSSWDALADDTRGRGPFDSHVNGAMLMKELKFPWLHWHSMAQTIRPDAFDPADVLQQEFLFLQRQNAEKLESIVRFSTGRWTDSRLDKLAAEGVWNRPAQFLRQVVTTTTINIATSPDKYSGPDDGIIRVPISLIFDASALIDVIELDVDVVLTVERRRYRQAAAAIGLAVRDTHANPPFHRAGDAFFAWATPEPALEDINVLQNLIRRGLLSDQFAASLLMVDYSNPILSKARATLMAFVPQQASLSGTATLEATMRTAIVTAAATAPNGAPARVAADNLALPAADWRDVFAKRLIDLTAAVQSQLDTDSGLESLMLLADSRRRAFRRRPIAEFDMTLPWADVGDDAPFLKLQIDGTVVPDD